MNDRHPDLATIETLRAGEASVEEIVHPSVELEIQP